MIEESVDPQVKFGDNLDDYYRWTINEAVNRALTKQGSHLDIANFYYQHMNNLVSKGYDPKKVKLGEDLLVDAVKQKILQRN